MTNHSIVERNDGEIVVRPAGDVVAANAPELRTAMREAIAEGGRYLTLDFSSVAMVDSAGLGLLVAAHNSLKRNGGRLAIAHASKDILDLFRSMRMHQHFTLCEN